MENLEKYGITQAEIELVERGFELYNKIQDIQRRDNNPYPDMFIPSTIWFPTHGHGWVEQHNHNTITVEDLEILERVPLWYYNRSSDVVYTKYPYLNWVIYGLKNAMKSRITVSYIDYLFYYHQYGNFDVEQYMTDKGITK